MNNLKRAREEMGLTQPELAALVRTVEPRIDVGMLSRFENGVFLPTPDVARRLASLLGSSIRDLFGEDGQTYIFNVMPSDEPVEPLPFEVEDLLAALTTVPKTRRELCEELDVGDRHLRELIAKAQKLGYLIANDCKGDGYYIPTHAEEMRAQYKREESRLISLATKVRNMKNYLKKMGVPV